jgi:hypothetical protein
METSPGEEWQVRVLRAGLIWFSSFFMIGFVLGLASHNSSPIEITVVSAFIATLLAVSTLFSKVPALRFRTKMKGGITKMSLEWKMRILRAAILSIVVFSLTLVLARELVDSIWIPAGEMITGYEIVPIIFSPFIGLASILFDAPSEFPSMGLKRLNTNERAKVKRIGIFSISTFFVINLILLTSVFVSGMSQEMVATILIGMVPMTLIFTLILTMGYLLIVTSDKRFLSSGMVTVSTAFYLSLLVITIGLLASWTGILLLLAVIAKGFVLERHSRTSEYVILGMAIAAFVMCLSWILWLNSWENNMFAGSVYDIYMIRYLYIATALMTALGLVLANVRWTRSGLDMKIGASYLLLTLSFIILFTAFLWTVSLFTFYPG